jgi:hypothetical protein
MNACGAVPCVAVLGLFRAQQSQTSTRDPPRKHGFNSLRANEPFEHPKIFRRSSSEVRSAALPIELHYHRVAMESSSSKLKSCTCLCMLSMLLSGSVYYVYLYWTPLHPRKMQLPSHRPSNRPCPSVQRYMVEGWWKPRPISDAERQEIDAFFETVMKTTHPFPSNSSSPLRQREDMRCGNVTLRGNRRPFDTCRALCDPKGDNPCCYQGTCVDRPTGKVEIAGTNLGPYNTLFILLK